MKTNKYYNDIFIDDYCKCKKCGAFLIDITNTDYIGIALESQNTEYCPSIRILTCPDCDGITGDN